MRRFIWYTGIVMAFAVPASLQAQGKSAEPQRTSRDLLTLAQLKELRVENAYDAVEAVRSIWLRERGPTSFTKSGATVSRADSLTGTVPLVYLDRVKLGTVEEMKRVPMRNVFSIQHFNGIEATSRYGVGHSAGVILITTMPVAAPTPDPDA